MRASLSAARPPAGLWIALGALSAVGLLTYPLPFAWLGLGGLALLAATRWWRRRRPCPGSPFNLPLGLYLAGGAVGLYASVSPQTAEIRFFGLLGAVGAFFVVRDGVDSTRAASRVAGVSLLAVVVAAPLLFILDAPSVTLERLPGPLASLIAALIPAVQPLRHAILADDPAFSQRYVLHVAGLGTLAAFGAGLALGPLLAGPTPRARLLGGLALAWCGLFLVLSSMRGALLSALLVALLFGSMRQRWLLAGALLVLAVAVAIIAGLVRPGTGGPPGPALGSPSGPIFDPVNFRLRQELWDNARFMLSDFRFTGVGLGKGSVREVYGEYFLPVEKGIGFYHAHSSIIQSYLEQGLLGLLGLLGLMAVGLAVGWRTLARARDPMVRSTAISAGAAALALVLAGLTEVVLVTTVGTMLLCASLGLLDAAGRLEAAAVAPLPARRRVGRPSPVALGAGGVLLALLMALAMPLISLAQGTAAPQSATARLTQPLRAALAELYLNLGALEVTKITLGKEPPRAERRQRLATAESFLNRARELDPGNLAIYRNLASVDLAQGQTGDALRVLEEAEALAPPDDNRSWFQLGRLYREAGDVDRAVAAWSRADPSIGALNASGPDAQLIRWGADLVQRGRWEAAVKVNRAAVRSDPVSPIPYDSLSAAVVRRWGQDAALAEMQELAEVYTDIPWPLVEIGDLYRRAGDQTEAQLWYRKAAAIAPDERVIRERLGGRSGA